MPVLLFKFMFSRILLQFKSSLPKVLYKKVVLNFAKIQRKTTVREEIWGTSFAIEDNNMIVVTTQFSCENPLLRLVFFGFNRK